MSLETSGELRFVGEECRVIVLADGDGAAVKSFFEGVPNLPKLKDDVENHRRLVEKLGASQFVPITNAVWGVNQLELQFAKVLGKSFAKLAPLSDEATVSILVQLAGSLEHLHEAGSWSGWLDPRLVYLGDKCVSIALVLPAALQSRSNKHESNDGFIAPEFSDTSLTLDSRADVYGIGAIGFYLLTGSPPPKTILEQSLTNATKSQELKSIILKCLEHNPDDRFHLVGEIVEALDAATLLDSELDKPSLVVLNTAEKGQIFSLSDGPNTIGSDTASSIRLPQLHASVGTIQRSNTATTIKLNPDQTCKLNSHLVKSGQTRTISRGSILEFPPYRLRYLAANEIYSPQAEIELSGAETKSQQLFKKIGLMLTGFALLGLGYSVLTAQRVDAEKNANEKQKRIVTEAKLATFIWSGDFYLRSSGNKVSCNSVKCTKECSNAVECFSQALALDPSDTYAQARLSQAQKIIPEEAEPAAAPEDHSEEAKLVARAKALMDSGNLFCDQGECAEQLVNQALALNSLNSESQNLLTQLAAESVDRTIKARAEGNYSELEKNFNISVRLGVDSQYIAPLKAGLDVIKRSTSTVIIIDEHAKPGEVRKGIGRINNADLAERLSAEHGYKKPEGGREVLDISGFDAKK